MKKATVLCLAALMILSLCACGETSVPEPTEVPEVSAEQTATAPEVAAPEATAETWPVYLKKTDIASQPAHFIPIDQATGYSKEIITDELLSKPTALPDASVSSIPYWTGFVIDNMAIANSTDGRWSNLTDGSNYFYEDNIKVIAEEGFNCARILYSLSHLSKAGDPLSINETQLECLDELISWGLKYDVHIMISITGLPGKAVEGNEEANAGQNDAAQQESVQANDELFRNPELAKLYEQYMAMLISRYKGIPNRNLSFELLAEPAVPDGSVTLYEDTLIPIVETLKAIDSDRILIANDVCKQVPERLAAAGCALSVHNHIYIVDSSRLPDIDYQPTWPMEYLPGVVNDPEHPLTLVSETSFHTGSLSIYINQQEWSEGKLLVTADGKEVLKVDPDQTGWLSVDIPDGAKELTVGLDKPGYLEFSAVKLQQGQTDITLVRHDLYTGEDPGVMPTIKILDDGSTENISGQALDSEFFYNQYLKKFADVAKEYNVGFLMTEIGTDTYSLSKEDYIAYESTWLKVLRDNGIPWMYNCLHGVFAPEGSVSTDVQYACGFTEIERVAGTPFEKVTGIFDFLSEYQ